MKKKLMLILSCLILSIGFITAQTTKVSGVIVDVEGEPVIGAMVVIKGTAIGVTSDIDGKFSVDMPEKGSTLVFSLLGMKAKELVASNNMKVVMEEDVQALSEVVVTGVLKIDKRIFTGATDMLVAEDVKLDGIPEISRGLEGRSAGVSIQNVSGTFGAAPKIRIRGATSIYGASKPLWVVDGVVMEDVVDVDASDLSSGDAVTLVSSAISGLNADDIESFQILKDGSATSIYGARAMAGVIVITTKKGKAGQSNISYTGEYSMRMKPSYSEFNIMNSQEQMGIYKEMAQKGWLNFAETLRASSSGVYGKMYQLIDTYDRTSGQFGLMNTSEAMNLYLRQAEMRNTDWFDELFNNNITQNHSVSVSTGTERATFYGSLSAMIDPGWYKQSEVNRYTANFNSSFRILDNLSLNMISNASYRKQRAPGTLNQEVDPVNGEVKREFDINPYSYAINSSRALDPDTYYTRNYAPFNISHELANNYMEFNVADLKYQAEFAWKPMNNLELKMLGALKYSTNSQEHYIKDDSNQALSYRAMDDATIAANNPFLYTDPDIAYSEPFSILPEGGIYKRYDRKMLGYDFRTSGHWNKTFDRIHYLEVLLGGEVHSTERKTTSFTGWGTQYKQGNIPFYTYYYFKKGIEEGSDYYSISNQLSRMVSLFGTATYSYSSKYVGSFTGSYEGSNFVGGDARWLPTWNISGKWNAHEEKFFESVRPTLSHASLKASYSLTAYPVSAITSNSSAIINSYKPWRPYSSLQESGLQLTDIANSELTSEKKNELNIGAELGFLNNRINVELDWYTRSNKDLIGQIPTSGVGGVLVKYANVANMKSHGVDFSLSTKNIVSKDFNWDTSFILGYVDTEITNLMASPRVIDLISGNGAALEGYPFRGLFSFQFMGLNNEGLPTFLNQNEEVTVSNLNMQLRDNGTGNLDFLKYEGPADPKYTGSIGNIFRYKNFKLNLFVTYSAGNVIRLDPVFSSSYSDLTATTRDFKNRWTLPGDESITDIPVIIGKRQQWSTSNIQRGYNAYNYSSRRIAKGDFIRMKEISLTYDINSNLLPKEIKTLSLKLQATNPFLIYSDSKLNGQDPEFFRSGGVASPVPKQFTFTVRLRL